jgi:hypothetical protein
MPKDVFTPIELDERKPDRCELCPLVGIIPKEQREKGKREKYWCLGILKQVKDEHGNPILDDNGVELHTFPRLSSRSVNNVSARDRKEKGHPIHRPCDATWPTWMTLQNRTLWIPSAVYTAYRIPFDREQMLKKMPMFNFRQRNRKS